jgi:hypothetical protein
MPEMAGRFQWWASRYLALMSFNYTTESLNSRFDHHDPLLLLRSLPESCDAWQ